MSLITLSAILLPKPNLFKKLISNTLQRSEKFPIALPNISFDVKTRLASLGSSCIDWLNPLTVNGYD